MKTLGQGIAWGIRMLGLGLIALYRFILRPLFGPLGQCRFYPSCSDYAQGVWRSHRPGHAFRLTIQRVVKCHPWHAGGIDPIPDQQHCSCAHSTTLTNKSS